MIVAGQASAKAHGNLRAVWSSLALHDHALCISYAATYSRSGLKQGNAMARGLVCLGVCAAMLVSAVAHAQNDRIRDYLKSQFSGWTGLSFYCEIPRGSHKTAENLCSWATQRVRILARQSGTPLVVVSSDPFQRGLDRHKYGNPLDLVLYIRTTMPEPGTVIAVYAAVRAAPFVRLPPDASSKGRDPRSGKLLLWDKDMIGSGLPGHEFEGALQQALETILMQFLNDYADGAK